MYYPPSYLWHFLLQTSAFVYNFYSGVNFCGKKICGNFILWELIFTKIAKIRTRKNLVPHGILMFKQILSTGVIRHIWKTVRRTCMLILELKGLKPYQI